MESTLVRLHHWLGIFGFERFAVWIGVKWMALRLIDYDRLIAAFWRWRMRQDR